VVAQDAAVDFDLEALHSLTPGFDLVALEVTDNHLFRRHTGQRVDLVATPLDDEVLRMARHAHADVPQRCRNAVAQPDFGQDAVGDRHLTLRLFVQNTLLLH
jgi:hypothetical protein